MRSAHAPSGRTSTLLVAIVGKLLSNASAGEFWQVTGIRHDAWRETNRIPNSVDKDGDEMGKFLHPDAFDDRAGAAYQNPAAASS